MDINEEMWHEVSNDFLNIYLQKNREYGSGDLKVMGRSMQLVALLPHEEDGVEAAILFYILGKVARATNALSKQERPSDDTIMDLAIYAMMAAIMRVNRNRIQRVPAPPVVQSEPLKTPYAL